MTASRQPASHETKAPPPPLGLGQTRTLLAADRTLMAWLRTALSMLSFGFTIYKFLEEFEPSKSSRPNLPQNIGLFLALMGTASIVMGATEYWHTLKSLKLEHKFGFGRPGLILAFIMLVSGLLLFVSIAFHLF